MLAHLTLDQRIQLAAALAPILLAAISAILVAVRRRRSHALGTLRKLYVIAARRVANVEPGRRQVLRCLMRTVAGSWSQISAEDVRYGAERKLFQAQFAAESTRMGLNLPPGRVNAIVRDFYGSVVLLRKTSTNEQVTKWTEYWLEKTSEPPEAIEEVAAEQAFHVKGFVGRDKELERLNVWLANPKGPQCLIVTGPAGQGKSALIAKFASVCASKSIPCLLHMVHSSGNPHRFMLSLLQQANKLLDNGDARDVAEDVEALRDQLVGATRELRESFGSALIVIDALDELNDKGQRLTFLPSNLHEGVRMLLSCRSNAQLVDRLRQHLTVYTDSYELQPLTENDVLLLMGRRSEEAISTSSVNATALAEHTKGNPLLLRYALDEIFRMPKRGNGSAIDMSILPNSYSDVFRSIYHEIAGGDGVERDGKIRARIIQVFSVAMSPLSLDDVRGILKGEGTALSLEQISGHVRHMSEYLMPYESERYLPWHPQLSEFIQTKILACDGLAQLHMLFANWFRSSGANRPYALQFLPSHLRQAATYRVHGSCPDLASIACQDLEKTLSDLKFLRSKVEGGFVYELISDYRGALDTFQALSHTPSTAFSQWHRFIDSQSHILSIEPALFLQQAVNQPSDSAIESDAQRALAAKAATAAPVIRWTNKPKESFPSPLLKAMIGHVGYAHRIVPGPGEGKITTGGEDGYLRVWDLDSGRCVQAIECGGRSIRGLDWSLDRTAIVVGQNRVGSDNTGVLSLCRIDAGQPEIILEEKSRIRRIAVSLNGSMGLIALDDGVAVCDLQARMRISSVAVGQGPCHAVCWLGDNLHFLTAGDDGVICLWKLFENSPIRQFEGHEKPVSAIALAGENLLLSGSHDGTVRFWDVATGDCLLGYDCDGFPVKAIALSGNGKITAWGNAGGDLTLYDLVMRKIVGTIRGHAHEIDGVVLSYDGQKAIVLADESAIQVWDVREPNLYSNREWHMGASRGAAVTADGKWAVTTGYVTVPTVWDVAKRTQEASLVGHTDVARAVAVTPGARRVLTGAFGKGSNAVYSRPGEEECSVRLWDGITGAQLGMFKDHTNAVRDLAITPDAQVGLSVGWDKDVLVWDLQTLKLRHRLEGHESRISGVAVTPDGKMALTGDMTGVVRLWDVVDGVELREMTAEGADPILAVATTPDGLVGVSGHWSGALVVWDLATGVARYTVLASTGRILSVAISADGRRALTGDFTGVLRVWDLESAARVASFYGRGAILTCEFGTTETANFVAVDRSGRVYWLRLD